VIHLTKNNKIKKYLNTSYAKFIYKMSFGPRDVILEKEGLYQAHDEIVELEKAMGAASRANVAMSKAQHYFSGAYGELYSVSQDFRAKFARFAKPSIRQSIGSIQASRGRGMGWRRSVGDERFKRSAAAKKSKGSPIGQWSGYIFATKQSLRPVIGHLEDVQAEVAKAEKHNERLSSLARKIISHLKTVRGRDRQYLTQEEGHVLGTCKGFNTAWRNTIFNPVRNKVKEIYALIDKVDSLGRESFGTLSDAVRSDTYEEGDQKISEVRHLHYALMYGEFNEIDIWLGSYLHHHLFALTKIVRMLFVYKKHMTEQTQHTVS